MVCSVCGFENESGATACSNCGASLERRCPSCGAGVPAGSAFCGRCGARVAETGAHATEVGDRRVVTALFADLSGFTSLAEQLDPEDLTNLINECFGGLMEEVRLRGGWLEKQIGDALVAIFGAPVVHEDDPERAVHAALAMRERMLVHNERLGARLGRPLELHIGVNTGLVVMGRGLETGEGDELVVLGDTVNVAARLQQVARAGQILVGEATHSSTSSAFDFRKLPPLTVKGKAEPLTAYECVRARARRARAAEDARVGSPLVGRDADLAAVLGCVESLRPDAGGVLAVLGEAGLGKSRLMAEARMRLPATVHWIEGRALSFGQTISYFPFIEIVKTDAGIAEEDGEEEGWRKLDARVRAVFPEEQVAEILPYLAALLGLEVRGELAERVKYLDGESMGHQIFRASRLMFEALARERPTVLVFEDFHWADESSEALLKHLLPLVEDVPLLICCPTRPDPDTPGTRFCALAGQDHPHKYTEVVLNQLTPAETAELVRNLLAVELSPRLRQIFARGEGNPFFLEEVVRSLIDMGAFARDEASGRWQVVTSVDEITIPDTIQGVIMARIDRLDEEAKQVLRTASVIGRSFFYQVLRALTEMNGGLDSRLAELEGRDLIRQKGIARELEYIFKHALTREAVYGSILLRRRRELHARVAGCIESLFPDDLEEFNALLAYHYAQAEDWEKAKEYLFKAGDQAGKLAADAEALAHYRQALDAHARLFGDRWDPFERALLERKIGEALFRRGENDLALEHLQRALVHLGSPYPVARSGVRVAIVRQLLRQIGHRLLPLLFLRRRAVERNEVAQERSRIWETMGWIHYFTDQEGLLLDGLLMTNFAERTGNKAEMVAGWTGLGFGLDLVPMFGVAERYDRRSVALAQETGHPAVIGFAHFGLGFHEQRLGRFASALEHYGLAADAYLQAGELRKWAAGARQTAQIAVLQGRLVESLDRCHEVVRVGEDAGDQQSWAWGSHQLGASLWRIGVPEEAARHVTEAIAVFEGIPDYGSTAAASGDLAHCHLLQGEVQEAITLLEAAERLIAERKIRGFHCTEPRLAMAEARLIAAEQAGESERAALLKQAKKPCKVARKQAKLDRQALPAACRHQGVYHWLKGDQEKARTWWRKSIEAAEELEARYEIGMTSLELGRRAGDPEHVARGEALLDEISAARRTLLTAAA